MKQFTTHTPQDLPGIADSKLMISDWCFGKVRTLSGEIKNTICAYDFKKLKWIFPIAGHVELIEYYREI